MGHTELLKGIGLACPFIILERIQGVTTSHDSLELTRQTGVVGQYHEKQNYQRQGRNFQNRKENMSSNMMQGRNRKMGGWEIALRNTLYLALDPGLMP